MDRKSALALANQIETASGKKDHRLKNMVAKLRRAARAIPMINVLDKVPGATVTEKCEIIGVTRQAYYNWRNSVSRPNRTQAKRLARLTGLSADHIRG